MRFVFRADASSAIGSGHVMRSSAIAEEAIGRGLPSVFVGEVSELAWVDDRIKNLGFSQVFKNSGEFSSNQHEDVLIIDSYEISPTDPFLKREKWRAVVSVFDEMTPDYVCDLRIHPGLTNNWLVPFGGKTLSGPKYVPLRKSIMKSDQHKPGGTLELLVLGGGSDTYGFVPAVVKVLNGISSNFHATLFINSSVGVSMDERFSVSKVGLDLDLVANLADLVFTTASTTSLEFLARGSAVAVGCAIDNQELYYKELSAGYFAAPIGKFLNNSWELNSKLIKDLVSSETQRARLKANSAGLIDLNGAKRIVDEILKL
jgi:spore coat polysaccharide biosynthesis predicted glycosyltransferase SpsG